MFINSSSPMGWESMYTYIQERALQPKSPVWLWTNRQLADYCQNSNNHWQAKTQGKSILAFLLFKETGSSSEIYFLETHAKYLRQGHMSELIKTYVYKQKKKEIWVDVHQDNEGAVELYLRLGFKLVGKRKAYYRDGGGSLLMTYSV